jgi:Rad3-related DNA helicase
MDKFVENILNNVMDIEELAQQGSRQAVCPYYAAREAVSKADFVLVPYHSLIHRCAGTTSPSRAIAKIRHLDTSKQAHN